MDGAREREDELLRLLFGLRTFWSLKASMDEGDFGGAAGLGGEGRGGTSHTCSPSWSRGTGALHVEHLTEGSSCDILAGPPLGGASWAMAERRCRRPA